MLKKLFRAKSTLLSFFAISGRKKGIALFTLIILASFCARVVFAALYNPGDTLNPSCLPTDTNCDVIAPLTSLTGAVLTDQTVPQIIGLTAARLAKLWATDIATTDLTVTNTIIGSISGNAGTATKLAATKTINGVAFDGSANITVPSDIAPGASGNLLTSNGTVWTSVAPAASGANLALSNLSAVAINTALLPGAAGALDLGSTAKPWASLWLAGTSGTPGTNQFEITGASTGGLRTITLPDNSGTVALTSNLSSYLPLTGGTLTGQLTLSNASNPQLVISSTARSVIQMVGASNKNIEIEFDRGSGSPKWSIGVGMATNGNNFAFYDQGASLTRMNLTTAGDLGLGIATATPGARLEVRGSTADNTAAALSVTNSTPTNLFYVRNDGNVGIGTASPNYKLEVNGTSGFTGNMVMTADNTYDLGASGATRPRTGYFGTSVVAPLFTGNLTGDVTGNVSGNAGTVTGLSVTAGKVLTVSNSLTLAGTDSSTLNIGTGGTLGTNAFTSTAYLPLTGGTLTGNLIAQQADADTEIRIINSSSTSDHYPALWIKNYKGSFGGAPTLNLLSSRGSLASPTPVQATDILAQWSAWGQSGNTVGSYQYAGFIEFTADSDFTGGGGNSVLTFGTALSGATTERMRLDANGKLGIGTTGPSQMLSVGASNQFTVTSVGAVTAVGVNSGSGLLQGTGGLTITGTVSLPNSSISNAMLANSTISGVALGSNLSTLTFGTHLASGGSSYNGSASVTITSDATDANTVSTIVARDASGNFSAGTITATTFSGAVTGHSSLDLPLTGGTLTGNLLFTDNTYDIGASGATRPRTGYFGTSIITPVVASTAGSVLALSSTAPAAITTAQAGIAATLTASNAVAGSSVAGAAAGGSITLTAGNAAQLTSGNANGGSIILTPGTKIGSGVAGSIDLAFPTGTFRVRSGDSTSIHFDTQVITATEYTRSTTFGSSAVAGRYSTTIGDHAGSTGDACTIIGDYAAYSATGANCTVIGQAAGQNMTGAYNTLVGSGTGMNGADETNGLASVALTTGTSNFFAGFYTSGTNSSITNSVAIGTKSRVTADNMFVFGGKLPSLFQFGSDSSDTQTARVLRAAGARAGTDTDTAGSGLTLASGIGTGTGTVTTILFQTPDVAASGTTAQTLTTKMTLGNGLQVGAPTGGDKGAGTINISGDIYKNNTAYTNPDYVFEKFFTGNIVKFANNPGATTYTGLKPLTEVQQFAQQQYELPLIASGQGGLFGKGDSLLASVEESYLYLFQHETKINDLNLSLESITGTVTPIAGSANESFMTAFFKNLFAKIGTWLADAGNSITDVFAGTFHAKDKLCINSTCVTEAQLQLLLQNSATPTPPPVTTPPPTTTTTTTTPPPTTTPNQSAPADGTGQATTTTTPPPSTTTPPPTTTPNQSATADGTGQATTTTTPPPTTTSTTTPPPPTTTTTTTTTDTTTTTTPPPATTTTP